MFTRLQQICPILFSSIFETERDGINGRSSTGAARQTPFYVCVTEHTRNIDGTAADGNLVKAGDSRCLAWQLERAYPAEFARPEVALNLAIQNHKFRPGKGCKDALRRVDELLKSGYHWVVDADLKGYFDSIPQEVTQNHLTIQITGTKYARIEAESEPVRQQVAEMFAKYRPSLG
jgi:hypothetical protein